MTCSLEKLLSAYIDLQLPAWQYTVVSGHLAECRSCQAEVDSLQYIRLILGKQPKARLPDSLRSSIEAMTVSHKSWWPDFDAIRWWLPPLAVAAALGGWGIARQYQSRHPGLEAFQARRPLAAAHDQIAWHRDPELSLPTTSQQAN